MRVFKRDPESVNEREFRGFVIDAAPVLLRAAVMLSRDRATAEDLVQTTFGRVARRWTSAREAPLAYSRRVLINVARDEERRSARRPTAPPSEEHLQLRDAGDPAGQIVDRLILIEAVRGLPEPQRAVVVLRFYLDLSVEETSKLLEIPTGTIKSATSRAIAKLAGVVSPEELEPIQVRGGI
jgi:RNA polymerase sigma-70 factor (sigma-E family)